MPSTGKGRSTTQSMCGDNTHHGVWVALVSIAETGFKPSRGFVEDLGGPLAIGEIDGGEGLVLRPRFLEPGFCR